MKTFNSINEILDFAINAEQNAVDFYKGLALKVKNQSMKEVFEKFANEEILHKAKLLKVKKDGVYPSSDTNIPDLKISESVDDVIASPDMSYQEALVIAMKNEKNAFKMYYELSESAPNKELKDLFFSMAQEEAKHKLRFEIEYDEFVLKDN